MTLTLILIRHCKSDWEAGIASDHARPLNARGRRDAPRIGTWLTAQNLIPDSVLCSDARRTQETWAGIADHLPRKPRLHLSHALYHAEPEVMLHAITQAKDATIALVGHNPGIGSLAWALAQIPPDHTDFARYPTGATTVLTFDVPDWAKVGPGQGKLRAFTTPHDLPD